MLLRVDFNVPLRGRPGRGRPAHRRRAADDPSRARARRVGRAAEPPRSTQGRVDARVQPCARCAARLAARLGATCSSPRTASGPRPSARRPRLGPGDVLLLENLRFHPGEEKPEREPGFAGGLGAARRLLRQRRIRHRASSPRIDGRPRRGVPRACRGVPAGARDRLPSGASLAAPERPFLAHPRRRQGRRTRSRVIENLLERVDALPSVVRWPTRFLAAPRRRCRCARASRRSESSSRADRRATPRGAASSSCCPLDHVCGASFAETTETRVVRQVDIPAGWMGLDIGPRTVARLSSSASRTARTMIWNGPMGVFEWRAFAEGHARRGARLRREPRLDDRRRRRFRRRGRAAGLTERFSHVSTGGGASLELLEGKDRCPGVAVLTDRSLSVARADSDRAGNWKMNGHIGPAIDLVAQIKRRRGRDRRRRGRGLPTVHRAQGGRAI